jgi:subtilisin family serine protease
LEVRALLSAVPATPLLIQLKSAPVADVSRMVAADGASLQPTGLPGVYQASGGAAALGTVASQLAFDPGIGYVEPVQTLHVDATPNDQAFVNGSLWGLNGANGINAPIAWNITTGSTKVTVADIDTGIDYNHPDLYENVWLNSAEIPPSRMANLKDFDGDGLITFYDLNYQVPDGSFPNQGPGKIMDINGDGRIDTADVLAPMQKDANGNDTGYGGWADGISEDGDTAHVDDLVGWNFVNNTNNPFDDNGHGTHTAGTIGAIGNNGVGVVGVNWQTQIMALKFLDASGSGNDLGAAEAVRYAADHGARVSNNSYGGGDGGTTLSDAIAYAASKGDVFVAAAGNSGQNTDQTPNYPSAYPSDNIIAVAAIDSDGSLASFSNYGPTTVDIAAPGVAVYSTLPGGNYASWSGTSMATPHVTGTVALVLALHPDWSYSQLIQQVLSTARPDPALSGLTVTGGVVDAGAAVTTGGSQAPAVGDAGFEQVAVGDGAYQFDPTGSAWTFAGNAGVSGNDSGFTAGNPAAPEGSQVAFLQYNGSASQAVSGWAAGTYVVTFDAAQRGNWQASAQDFEVLIDGQVVGTFTPADTSYRSYATAAFTVSAGTHTITFQGLDSAGGDNTAFIDQVAIQ